MQVILPVLFILGFNVIFGISASISMIADSIVTNSVFSNTNNIMSIDFAITANGIIYEKGLYNDRINGEGHFRYLLSWDIGLLSYNVSTSCFPYGIRPDVLEASLLQTGVQIWDKMTATQLGIGNFNDHFDSVQIKRFFNGSTGSSSSVFRLQLTTSHNITVISMAATTASCFQMHCIRSWNDVSSWVPKVVPTAVDDVTVGSGAGVLLLSRDVNIRSLSMSGGIIVGHTTACPAGWSMDAVSAKTGYVSIDM